MYIGTLHSSDCLKFIDSMIFVLIRWKKRATKFGMHKALMTPYFDDESDKEENVENGGDAQNEQKQNGKAIRKYFVQYLTLFLICEHREDAVHSFIIHLQCQLLHLLITDHVRNQVILQSNWIPSKWTLSKSPTERK